MKKTLLAGALAVLCAGVAGVVWSRRDASPVSPAQLVPAEALFLAEVPDIPATALRWKGTALHAILDEPELRAFLSRPVAGTEPGGEWADTMDRLKRARPRQAFLAVTSMTDNRPQAVAGLEFTGDRQELEPLISRAMIRAQNSSPHGSIKRIHYRGCSVITFKHHGVTMAGCFAKNWYFVANDVELLKSTLDRLAGKSHLLLAYSSRYRESQLALPPRADLRLFLEPPLPTTRVLTRMDASALPSAASGVQFESAVLAVRIEGKLIHDTLVLRQNGGSTRGPALNGRTLALTTPNTLFYGAMAPQLETWFNSSGRPGGNTGRLVPTLLAALAPPKAPDLTRFQAAFGPEHALFMDWPRPSMQPDLFVASEVRDDAQARRFMENLFRTWDRADAGGVSMWTFSVAQPAPFHPAVALAGRHLVAGLSSESLKPFAQHAVQQPGGGLERTGAFRGSMAQLAKPETALAYIDTAALFERIYTTLRPAAMLWGPGFQPLNRYADFSRFPSSQAVTRHLSPISLTARQTAQGLVIDTAGPVSFVELGAGLGAGAFYATLPSLRPRNPNPPSILPPPPAKPLSNPAPNPESP